MAQEIKLPLVALRDTVIFPEAVEPLFIGRQKSIAAIYKAYNSDKKILVITQKDPSLEVVSKEDLYQFGTIGRITQLIKLTDGTVKILLEGETRASVEQIIDTDEMMEGIVIPKKTKSRKSKALDGLRLVLLSAFDAFCKQSKKLPLDITSVIPSIEDPDKLCDTIASYLPLKVSEQQELLEQIEVKKRIERIIFMIEERTELFLVEKRIKSRVKEQVEKNQKEYYLNEQLKAINKELGNSEEQVQELLELEQKINNAEMTQEAHTKALQELKKLRNMPNLSQEGAIIRNYIDWLINIPWQQATESTSIEFAEKILNDNHYGLDKVKDRILEYIAVRKRIEHKNASHECDAKVKSQILCFVGPPGVGKTSLGKAIADAVKRPFVRIALGGICDEAEIRGHRKTYVGAMPGKIIQAMKKINVNNPVIMLDEIDKIGMDVRGDPASALLEVLDPEQNNSFVDNYLEIPYDLSGVIFIATANGFDISVPLLDRMEVIQLSGYTEEEKLEIAKRFILPKQKKENGIADKELKFTDEAINNIIRYYTMESGVRSLERQIAKISRKVVRKLVSKEYKNIKITKDNVKTYLGAHKYTMTMALKKPMVGVVMGLAWTEMGGDVLTIEALKYPGTGQLITTGKLGEVMQESMKAAYSFVKFKTRDLKLDEEEFTKNDIHIHVPEGAVPKDGPSAGITVCTAIVSVLTNKKVRSDVAMTGEITLIGKVLGIGGLKEKLLAARRSGIKTVFIPKENEKDIAELPKSLQHDLNIQCVSHVNEVLENVFVKS